MVKVTKNQNSEPLKLPKITFLDRLNSLKFENQSGGKMIKFQQSQDLTSHFVSFCTEFQTKLLFWYLFIQYLETFFQKQIYHQTVRERQLGKVWFLREIPRNTRTYKQDFCKETTLLDMLQNGHPPEKWTKIIINFSASIFDTKSVR